MDVGHCGAGEDLLVDEEGVNPGKLRSDSTQETDTFDGDHHDDEGGDTEANDSSGSRPVVSSCLEKSATLPCPGDKASSLDSSNDDDSEKASNLLFSEEPSQATEPRKLIPAIKGTREKLGKAAPGQQLNVTWAPDVYDPVPNSLCHTVVKSSKKKSRKEKDRDNNHHHNKKNGKKGQKGSTSSSRGGSSSSSSSKDKKQVRRKPDKSSYKTLDICDDDDGFGDSSSGLGFDVASADNCGSSFLKKSVTEFHYSVAEAL